jgi:hypothetical protein
MFFIGETVKRFAAARRRRRARRAMAEILDYLLADTGFMRGWRGDGQKLPPGFFL